MPKKPPKYALHKPTGQAYVRIHGKFHYLGAHGSAESHEQYDKLISKWLTGSYDAHRDGLSVARLAVMYVDHARTYYRKGGKETSEVHSIQTALRPLTAKCGREKVSRFGPRRLKAVRDEMIRLGWTRSGINAAVRRINRMLRWGVESELLAPSIYQACKAVTGLRRGRCQAREPAPIKPVPDADVEAVKPHVSEEVWAMIQLQLATGMRPGEVCIMRLSDIDRSGSVWEYSPHTHKTEHHGRDRTVFLGPRAQSLIQQFLTADRSRYLFSPRKAEANRNAERRENRKSPMTPSQAARKPSTSPKKTAGDRYQRSSYARAITRACKKAKVDVWSPNRLRHNAATALRKKYGLEAARTVLGHTEANTTLFYAEVDLDVARKVISEAG